MIDQALAHAGNLTNASSSLSSGFGSTTALVGAVVWVALVVVLVVVVRNSTYIQHLLDAVAVVGLSFYYAVHGAAALTLGALLATPIYLFATADGEAQGWVLAIGAFVVVGYGVLVLVGLAFRHLVVEPAMDNIETVTEAPDE